MKSLVAQMEAAPGQEEQNKVQIADLKSELSKAEGTCFQQYQFNSKLLFQYYCLLKIFSYLIAYLLILENVEIRNEEILHLKKDLRLKDETIQQREIDISCLRGQVNSLSAILDKGNIARHISLDSKENDDRDGDDADDDSDTLTNIDPLSEEDILLEDLYFGDDESPIIQNTSSKTNIK